MTFINLYEAMNQLANHYNTQINTHEKKIILKVLLKVRNCLLEI